MTLSAPPSLLPVRLEPGADLRDALIAAVRGQRWRAAFVISGIGSLRQTRLRLAGRRHYLERHDDIELLTLAGSLGEGGAHLHASIADRDGQVLGGHVGPGCLIRTTAEVLLIEASGWRFGREPDPQTGFDELVIRPDRGSRPDTEES